MPKRSIGKLGQLAQAARDRVSNVREWADGDSLIDVLTINPSLRGIVMGYIGEVKFEEHVLPKIAGISSILKPDDHARKKSKSDRTFMYDGRLYGVQLKSIQTNSIREKDGRLVARVQNDASDSRTIVLPSGKEITTTCYLHGEYDILAVPLYPFTGSWSDFAFKRNRDLSHSRHKAYLEEDRKVLLATTEEISWPLDETWTTDLRSLLDATLGIAESAMPPSEG